MKIAVVAFDTRGGVQPYVALALGLQQAGHHVTMITTEAFTDLVTGHGIRLAATTGDAEATARGATGVAEMSTRNRQRFMREQMLTAVEQTTHEVLAAASGADVLLGGVGGSITGRPVAEKLGVPWIEAHLQPLGPATASFPGPLLSGVPGWLGGVGRRASHALTNAALRVMFGAGARRTRSVLGLPRRARPVPADLPAVYGFSPVVVPQPPEWGEYRKITSYWTLPPEPGWTPPVDLVDFLTSRGVDPSSATTALLQWSKVNAWRSSSPWRARSPGRGRSDDDRCRGTPLTTQYTQHMFR